MTTNHIDSSDTGLQTTPPAPLWRRLAAAAYDGMLLIGLWLGLLLADEILRGGLLGLAPQREVLRMLLLGSGLLFFGWFWIHGGQTLGMRAWRLRVQKADGAALRWRDAALRYLIAWLSWTFAGLGMLWCLIDRRGRAWHDLASGTVVILLPKKI